jgi:hypothetical protein
MDVHNSYADGGHQRRQLRSSAGRQLLYRAEALAKPNRQRFDGYPAFGHAEGVVG